MVIINKEKCEDIYSCRKIRKNKSISLPSDWSSYFTEKISIVNTYCCIWFARHYLPRKNKNLLIADFYWKISGSNVSGKLRLHINMELYPEYNINFTKHKKWWEFLSSGSHKTNWKKTIGRGTLRHKISKYWVSQQIDLSW